MHERSIGGRGSPACRSVIKVSGRLSWWNTDLMKWTKHSRGRVPLASFLTNSCSTYSFQMAAVPWMSNRVNGWGLLDVVL